MTRHTIGVWTLAAAALAISATAISTTWAETGGNVDLIATTAPAQATSMPGPKLEALSPEEKAAVAKGLAWLVAQQKKDGHIGGLDTDHPAITGLAGIGMLMSGTVPGKDAAGQALTKAIHAELAAQDNTGLIGGKETATAMYEHGFAMLFLARALGQIPDKDLQARVKTALENGVALLAKTQNKEGGWRYQPVPMDADISVTAAQLMALKGAQDAGIKVDPKMMQKAVTYVRKLQGKDGGFAYTLTGGDSAWARSAAGVAVLEYAGLGHDQSTKDGLKYLAVNGPTKNEQTQYFFYGSYYVAHAMNLAPDGQWQTNYKELRKQLLAKQDPKTGAWDGEAGKEYATAMALIMLGIPK